MAFPLTDLKIFNMALLELGEKRSTNSSFLSAPVGLAEEIGAEIFEQTRDALLRSHTWNFSKRRILLDNFVAPQTTLTLGAVTGENITATAGIASFFSDDIKVQIREFDPNPATGDPQLKDGKLVIENFDSSTVVRGDITDDFTKLSFVADEWAIEFVPQFDFGNFYILPSNYLTARNIDEGESVNLTRLKAGIRDSFPRKEWKVERRERGLTIVANEGPKLALIYIAQNAEPEEWDHLFVEVMVKSLAIKMAIPLSSSTSKKQQLLQERELIMRRAMRSDAVEQTDDYHQEAGVLLDVRG